MKQNIADLVEDHILKLLHREKSGQIEIQRNEVANAMSCAPSQVTYVLSTRFTNERGFVVESRRGLGGFIRITIIPLKNIFFEKLLEQIKPKSTLEDVHRVIRSIYELGYVTRREAQIVINVVQGMFETKSLTEEDRFNLIMLTLESIRQL